MEQRREAYTVKCSRCEQLIEFYNKPGPKMTCFLCNNCHLKWKEIEDRMIGHSYADEMRKAFVNFVETKPWTFNNKKVL